MSAFNLDRFAAIARIYGVPAPDAVPEPWTGATSRVYPCGDVVIKIPLDRPDAIAAVTMDAVMNPVMRDLGVRVPDLVTVDTSRHILPRPYAVYRRVANAVPLADFVGDVDRIEATWDLVGRDLALVHAVPHGSPMPVMLREFRQSREVDPRVWVDDLRERGTLSAEDAGWLRALLERLAPAALADSPLRLCHGDVNASNVMVDARSGEYRALIDWAGAGWLDPVWDFAGVSLDAVPPMLAGHRLVAPLADDDTAERRILWCQIQTRLYAAIGVADTPASTSLMAASLSQIRAFTQWAGI